VSPLQVLQQYGFFPLSSFPTIFFSGPLPRLDQVETFIASSSLSRKRRHPSSFYRRRPPPLFPPPFGQFSHESRCIYPPRPIGITLSPLVSSSFFPPREWFERERTLVSLQMYFIRRVSPSLPPSQPFPLTLAFPTPPRLFSFPFSCTVVLPPPPLKGYAVSCLSVSIQVFESDQRPTIPVAGPPLPFLSNSRTSKFSHLLCSVPLQFLFFFALRKGNYGIPFTLASCHPPPQHTRSASTPLFPCRHFQFPKVILFLNVLLAPAFISRLTLFSSIDAPLGLAFFFSPSC